MTLPVKDYLQFNESILATYEEFIATDHRLIRYQKGFKGETFQAMEYRDITTVKPLTKIRVSTILLGLLVAFLALVIGPQGPIRFILITLGLISTGIGFLNPRMFVRIDNDDQKQQEPGVWLIPSTHQEASRKLLAIVQLKQPQLRNTTLHSKQENQFRTTRLRRSVLLVPAESPALVRSGLEANPDSLCLDLSHQQDESTQDLARQLVWGEITAGAKSFSEILVLIHPITFIEDLHWCVWPGLSGVVVTLKDSDQIEKIQQCLTMLEAQRGLPTPVELLISIHHQLDPQITGRAFFVDHRITAILTDKIDLPANSFLSSLNLEITDRIQFVYSNEDTNMNTNTHSNDILDNYLNKIELAHRNGFVGAMSPFPQFVEVCQKIFSTDQQKTILMTNVE